MAYSKYTWADGELITAEKLNNLENGAAQATVPGPQGDKGEPGEMGPAGPQGPKGDPGDPGVGLTGEAAVLTALAADADAAAVRAKVNEVIDILVARGISTEPAPQPGPEA